MCHLQEMVIMPCIRTTNLIFPVSFIFINLHDIYQAHLTTQQVYDSCSLLGVSRGMDSQPNVLPSLLVEVI